MCFVLHQEKLTTSLDDKPVPPRLAAKYDAGINRVLFGFQGMYAMLDIALLIDQTLTNTIIPFSVSYS